MTDYTCNVTILDLDIPHSWQKLLQKLKKELERTQWTAGNINEETKECEFFEREILQQNINVFFHYAGRIQINTGSSMDRENLALIEKILKCKAKIDLHNKTGKLKFDFDYPDKRYTDKYALMPKYEKHTDIPRGWNGWDFKIYGYTWNDQNRA